MLYYFEYFLTALLSDTNLVQKLPINRHIYLKILNCTPGGFFKRLFLGLDIFFSLEFENFLV